jgi:hypothetical protein
MLQNSGSVTTRINPPLSPAEREQRYQQVLRELRDPKFYQIRITGMLLKRGYLWPNERDDLNALPGTRHSSGPPCVCFLSNAHEPFRYLMPSRG